MENQSLGYYLNQLSLKRSEDILEINESIERDYIFQALALELDKNSILPLSAPLQMGMKISLLSAISLQAGCELQSFWGKAGRKMSPQTG